MPRRQSQTCYGKIKTLQVSGIFIDAYLLLKIRGAASISRFSYCTCKLNIVAYDLKKIKPQEIV